MKENLLMAKICQTSNVWPHNLYKGILVKERKQRDFVSTSNLLILLQLLYFTEPCFLNIKTEPSKYNTRILLSTVEWCKNQY